MRFDRPHDPGGSNSKGWTFGQMIGPVQVIYVDCRKCCKRFARDYWSAKTLFDYESGQWAIGGFANGFFVKSGSDWAQLWIVSEWNPC